MSEPSRAKGRLTLLLIIVVFLLPVVAAYLYRPSGETGNHGTLIDPPRPLGPFRMTGLDGAPAGLETLRGKWTLLYPGPGHCQAVCRDNLFKMERARLTQGRDMPRVQALYLVPDTIEPGVARQTLVDYRGVRGYLIAPPELARIVPESLAGAGGEPANEAFNKQKIYLIDPLGNLMMYYSRYADPSGMKKDLKRLLKVSQIG